MIGTMGSFSHPSADLSEPLDCYLHGYVSSGIMKQTRANPEKGLPVTVAATKVDGIVLSLTPNSHSYNYRSAVLFGYGNLVEDPEEKLWAMKLVTDSVIAGRWEQSRTPPDKSEVSPFRKDSPQCRKKVEYSPLFERCKDVLDVPCIQACLPQVLIGGT